MTLAITGIRDCEVFSCINQSTSAKRLKVFKKVPIPPALGIVAHHCDLFIVPGNSFSVVA